MCFPRRSAAFRSRPSRPLLLATGLATVGTLAVPFLGSATRVFGFVPLSAGEVGAALAVVVAYLGATELAKRLVARNFQAVQQSVPAQTSHP